MRLLTGQRYLNIPVNIYSSLHHHRERLVLLSQRGDHESALQEARATLEVMKQSTLIEIPSVYQEMVKIEQELANPSSENHLTSIFWQFGDLIKTLPTPIESAQLGRKPPMKPVPPKLPPQSHGDIVLKREELYHRVEQLQKLKIPSSSWEYFLLRNIKRTISRINTLLSLLADQEAIIDPITIRTILKSIAEKSVGLGSEVAQFFLHECRDHLYSMNPEATVLSWLDIIGIPWLGSQLPRGHRVEGALAMLRWLSQCESESETEKSRRALVFQRLNGWLHNLPTQPKYPQLTVWWRTQLEDVYPKQLSHNLNLLSQGQPVENWLPLLEKHPHIEQETRDKLQSSRVGTRRLAENMLLVILGLKTKYHEERL